MRELEDFQYHIAQMNTADLAANAMDGVWLDDLSSEELIVLIHELVLRLPKDMTEDWYIKEEEEWEDVDDDNYE